MKIVSKWEVTELWSCTIEHSCHANFHLKCTSLPHTTTKYFISKKNLWARFLEFNFVNNTQLRVEKNSLHGNDVDKTANHRRNKTKKKNYFLIVSLCAEVIFRFFIFTVRFTMWRKKHCHFLFLVKLARFELFKEKKENIFL